MKKTAAILLIFLFLANLVFDFTKEAKAAGASFYLSPASATKYVGDRFNIYVYASASQAVNTFDVYLSSSNMTILGVNSSGSICLLFPEQPSYTPSSARFRCGLPTPGFTGSKGYIGAIVVKADSVGTGKITVNSNSQILANDGSGTNVINGFGSATFSIIPFPTNAPSVSSSTHPNQDTWYKNNNAVLSWSGDGNNFSYVIDQNPETVPDQLSEGSATSKTFEKLADGIWYFHVIVRGSNGVWSAPTTFRLQIDTTPPENFQPTADPKNNSEKRPIIGYSTTDKTSGISHYEVKLDNGQFVKVGNSYQIPSISSGKHIVYVKAVDKAGNERISSVDISIKEIPAPNIIQPTNNSTFSYGSEILLVGKSLPEYSIKIYLDDKEITTVKTDKFGNFKYVYKELLRSGVHEVYAVALNPDQISSPKSSTVKFNLDPKAYVFLGLTIPGVFLTSIFIFLIVILLILTIFFILGGHRFRKKLKKIIEELEEKVEEDLEKDKVSKKTQEKVEEEFEEAEKEISE